MATSARQSSMMIDLNSQKVVALIEQTEEASRVLSSCKPQVAWGRQVLGGAHVYLYAALLSDFVIAAERDDWIGPGVRMPDQSIQPTREWLVTYLFESMFCPLRANPGGELYLTRVKEKTTKILACHPERAA